MSVIPVIYQSCWDASGRPTQQITNLSLDGISTIVDSTTTDNDMKLYGNFTFVSPHYALNLYADITKDHLVATATATGFGTTVIDAANGSGLSGSVNFAQYVKDDTMIELQCLLTNDNDIPFAELQVLSDYSDQFGFAAFHNVAWEKVKEVVKSRYRSVLWNAGWVDTAQTNGGLGGFDLSRVLNWGSLREATAQYVLYKICEKQYVEGGSVWEKRSKEAYNRFRAHMESVEMSFDTTNQRVEKKQRTLATFRISRA